MGHAVYDFTEETLPALNAYRHIIYARLAVIVTAKPDSPAMMRLRVITFVHLRIISHDQPTAPASRGTVGAGLCARPVPLPGCLGGIPSGRARRPPPMGASL